MDIIKRLQNAEKNTDAALLELASVLDKQPMEGFGMDVRETPLFHACRLVGRYLGMTIKAPVAEYDAEGTSDDDLYNIARTSGIRIRKVTLRPLWWQQESGPLLGFMKKGHRPVALIPTKKGRHYELVDAPGEKRKPVSAEQAATLVPYGFNFYRTFSHGPQRVPEICRFIMFQCGRDLFHTVSMGILGGILGLLTPVATGIIFDSILPASNKGRLFQIMLALLVGALSAAIFQLIRSYAVLRIETRSDGAMQAAVWDRVLKLPASFFRFHTVGDLVNRIDGLNRIRANLSGVTVSTFLSGIFSIFSFGLLFYYSPPLALMASALVIFLAAVLTMGNYTALRIQRQVATMEGRLSGMVFQLMNGVAKLRAAGAESLAFAVWGKQYAREQRLKMKARWITNGLNLFGSGFQLICQLCIFGVVAHLSFQKASSGALSTGQFLAFNAAFGQFLSATLRIGAILNTSVLLKALYERIRPVMETATEIDPGKAPMGQLKGEIALTDITFRYTKESPLVLRHISLRVLPGQFVALVGPSGSGKSTILRLLLGFEKPLSGSICYDGYDIHEMDLGSFRRQLGVVLQGGLLFSGNIFQNIVGASNLTLKDAWTAARMAGLEGEIKRMPMGMHTMVSEGGTTFSMGQRQRLMIARALVHKPKVLFFDEATSALDNRSQDVVKESLERLRATRVVIAHRLSTVMEADCIYMVVDGEIVQSGSYLELISQKGPFADFSRRQIL